MEGAVTGVGQVSPICLKGAHVPIGFLQVLESFFS